MSHKCGMMVKVDLKKVYDRVDWDFMRLVLAKTRFKPHLQNLIMNVITSMEMQVCWNEET